MRRVFYLTEWPDHGTYPNGFVGYDESDDAVRLFCIYDWPSRQAFVSHQDRHAGSGITRPDCDFVLVGARPNPR